MRILIGYDGSTEADAALDDLQRAGLPVIADVVVVSAAPPVIPIGLDTESSFNGWMGQAVRESYQVVKRAQAETLKSAERARRSLLARFPKWNIKPQMSIDAPAHALLQKAETWRPDLIVLGCHGRTAWGRLLLGSVSQQVLHHAPASVRITRGSTRPKAWPPRLLIAMDGSRESELAVEKVVSREWPEGTQARLLAVVDNLVLLGMVVQLRNRSGKAGLDKVISAWLKGKLDSAAAKLSSRGIRVAPSIQMGDPRRVILKEAKKWQADCIFLGSRGLNKVERFLLGSVASAVAVHAPCSVEIVRTEKSGADGNRKKSLGNPPVARKRRSKT